MSNSLKQFGGFTTVLADTADYNAIKPYQISEATTNPSIIFHAASLPQYKNHVEDSVNYGLKTSDVLEEVIENAMDMITVSFGMEILKVVRGKVHIQIDPRLAFDTEKSVTRALKLIKMFKEKGIIDKNKLVVKIPATWEGIQTAGILEKNHKINCTMTTMFNLIQAAASAEAGVSYVAPFVGRIAMWYEEKSRLNVHPGVNSLKTMQNYMKKFGYKTKILGAYFMNADEVKLVAGCDTATLPISLIHELSKSKDIVENKMDRTIVIPEDKIEVTEDKFRWIMNEDEMATSLLAEVIRCFAADYNKLENVVRNKVLALK